MRPLIVALFALSCAQPTLAAPLETPKAVPRQMLSRGELRTCLIREQQLGRQGVALREAQEAHRAAGAKLSTEAIELSRVLRTLDNTDEVAVESYNRRNDVRNHDVEVHNKRADALNAVLADQQAAEADYLAACVSRPFLRVDEEAVLKEIGLTQRRSQRIRPLPAPRSVPRHDI
jgi:hypothetical protein